MKKFKRVAALACVGTMVMSQVVPAFAAEVSLGGNVGVENDNSEISSGEFKVELPTETEGLYDFTLDPDKLLYQYDTDSYNNTDTAYFAGMSAPVVENKATDTGFVQLGIMEWTEVSSPDFEAMFSITKGTSEEADVTAGVDGTVDATDGSTYAVWTPDPDGIADAKGMWTGITKDNYKNYITTTYKAADNTLDTIDLRSNGQSGEFVYDGKIYEKTFKAITDGNELAEYLTVTTEDDGSVSVALNAEKGDLYKAKAAGADPTKVTDTDTEITYTAPVAENTGISQTAKIVNNGLAAVVVTAQVNVNTDCGLEFAEAADFGTTTKKGDVYLALTQVDKAGAKTSYPVKTTIDAESGEVVSNAVSQTFILDGISAAGTTKYQDTFGEKDPATGSHNYRQYLNPNAAPSSQNFELTVKANDDASWKTKWADYVQKLRNEEAVKPVVSVVYSFNEEVLITKADRTNNAAQVFSAEGITYTADAKGKITAIRQVVSPEEVGYYEEGTSCGFTVAGADMKATGLTAKISVTGANGTYTALTIKKPTTSDGAATFTATSIKAEENVWVEVAVPAASATEPAMTYVFQIR